MPKIIEIRPNGTKRVATVNEKPSRTKQHHKDACDVNKIVEKYRKTGSITHVRNAQEGKYLDMTEMPSYQEALNTVIKAQTLFNEIPAEIRQRLGNDPQQLINYLADPKNLEESIELGLRVKPKKDEVLEELKSLNKKLETEKKPAEEPAK